MKNNVIHFPSNNSYNKGSESAIAAIEAFESFTLAYSLAVVESLHYQNPADYLRGFIATFRAEEEKRLII